MPTLVEEDPEYGTKVTNYLKKHGLERLPWGFIVAHGHLVANTSTEQRRHRALLGEVAIELLAGKGVTVDDLEKELQAAVMVRDDITLMEAEDAAAPQTPSDRAPET